MPWAIQGPSALRSPFAFEKTRQLLYRLTMFNFYFLSYVFSEERGRGWKWMRCNLWTISCCIKHLRVCVNSLQFMDYILLYDTFTCECVQQLYRLTIFSFYFSYLLCRRLPPGGRELIERDRETERKWIGSNLWTMSGCITHLCMCVHLDARWQSLQCRKGFFFLHSTGYIIKHEINWNKNWWLTKVLLQV